MSVRCRAERNIIHAVALWGGVRAEVFTMAGDLTPTELMTPVDSTKIRFSILLSIPEFLK